MFIRGKENLDIELLYERMLFIDVKWLYWFVLLRSIF